MKNANPIQIKVVIPDAGPLISLSIVDALDVLLVFRETVRIVITDFVEFEVTRYLADAPKLQHKPFSNDSEVTNVDVLAAT